MSNENKSSDVGSGFSRTQEGREREAHRELEHTVIAPGTVYLLLACFLIAIAAVPVAEWMGVRAGGEARLRQGFGGQEGVATAWADLFKLPGEIRAELAGTTPRPDSGLWRRLISANRIAMASLGGFERALEDRSLLARSLRPPTQVVMTGWLGAGNERVYPGRDGWLFYRPDVDYITGRPFLAPAEITRRVAAAPEWDDAPQPDPRVAIARFTRDLDARGITLVIMPTPLKPGVHPEMLARRYADTTTVLQNPSYRAFVDDLRRDGVLVFDPADALAAARRTDPQYLTTDTHWRPETTEMVAERLAGFITMHGGLPATTDPGYRLERVEVQNTGDVARMLDLPHDATLFPRETVWLRRVLQPDGSLWRSSRDADVLLLGDSFSNIYTLESMGWGTSAGLVEQLSYALSRPIDRLVQNDQGAFATRAMLAREPGRLDGKRVVVYQFAARELSFGDWKIIPLPTPPAR